MAQKSDKKKSSTSGTKKKVIPVKKPAVIRKVIVKAKKAKEIKKIEKTVIVPKKKEAPAPKVKLPTVPQEFRVNIRCRYCFFVDGYITGEKTCHNCKEEIFEIDKI